MNEKCQCPEVGLLKEGYASWYDETTELPFVNHEPGECQCTKDLIWYERDGKKLLLCSCCHIFGDKELTS